MDCSVCVLKIYFCYQTGTGNMLTKIVEIIIAFSAKTKKHIYKQKTNHFYMAVHVCVSDLWSVMACGTGPC